jgi:ribosomal protein S12 methylthiotransferase
VRYKLDFVAGRAVKTKMTELVRELARLGVWVRLHYVYPYPHVDEVIPLMAEGKVLPYLDVPFQHSHPRVLKAMKRPASGERNLERIHAWRAICPELTIRSTFIAGFPGETEAEFEHLLEFLREAELDRVGCFAYSPVEGAAANDLPGQLPDDVREERRARFMQVQEEISARRLARKVGTVQQVLVDEVGPKGAIGRTAADAPEIDGVVHVRVGRRRIAVGDLVDVKITSAGEHDLHGTA